MVNRTSGFLGWAGAHPSAPAAQYGRASARACDIVAWPVAFHRMAYRLKRMSACLVPKLEVPEIL
jgi:hypothetical protein